MPGTIDRVLKVLELFSGDQPEWTVESAADALKIPASTVYRYFRSLASSELIVAYAAGRYVLGPAIIQFDRQLRLNDPFISAAQPEMIRLASDIGGDVVILLARLYRDKVICVHQEGIGLLSNDISYQRGRPMPLTDGAPSKVILANIGPRATRSLAMGLAKNKAAAPTKDAELRRQLRQIRQQGFARSEAEVDPGVQGIAVPVFRPDQSLEGSLSVVIRAGRKCQQSMVEALIGARKAIEATLAIRASNLAAADWSPAD